jgi:hypothetical protein
MSLEEGEPSKEEESITIDQAPKEKPPEERKIIKTSKTVAQDYEKMVKFLIKQTGIKEKELEGMSPKEKFDRLSFFAEHSKTMTKNEKIVPESPVGHGTKQIEGITIMEHPVKGRNTLAIDPKTLFKTKLKE